VTRGLEESSKVYYHSAIVATVSQEAFKDWIPFTTFMRFDHACFASFI
jgi:hypothetical protein